MQNSKVGDATLKSIDYHYHLLSSNANHSPHYLVFQPMYVGNNVIERFKVLRKTSKKEQINKIFQKLENILKR